MDIAIISPDFGKDRFEEGKMLHRIAWRIDLRIEPVPISSKSFEKDTWIPLSIDLPHWMRQDKISSIVLRLRKGGGIESE